MASSISPSIFQLPRRGERPVIHCFQFRDIYPQGYVDPLIPAIDREVLGLQWSESRAAAWDRTIARIIGEL